MSKFVLSKGRKEKPDFLLVYGVDGVGKTTFACGSPDPVVIDLEGGSWNLDVARIDEGIDDFDSFLEALKFAASESFKSIVIDSADRLETLVWDTVCKEQGVKNIESIGYGKGYVYALQKWQILVNLLNTIRKTKNIIIIAHDVVKTFSDPTRFENYDRHEIKLHKGAGALLREECDGVFFATYKIFVKKDNAKATKGKAFGGEARVLFTERRPGHEGKNRIGLPYEISLDWASYQKAKDETNPKKMVESYLRQIKEMIPEIKDEKTREAVSKSIKDNLDLQVLKSYKNRIDIILEEQNNE